MRTALAAVASYVASVLLYLLASFTGSFVVRTTQPNGLAEIVLPYYAISVVATWAAFGALLFAIILSFVIVRGRTTMWTVRPLLGSGLLSGGVLAILFAGFWSLVNLEDEGPRCLDGCVSSLQQYYLVVYAASIVLAVIGLVAVGLGAWVLRRKSPLGAGPEMAENEGRC